MTILMIPALLLGLMLWLFYGIGKDALWMDVKLFLVALLLGYHHACGVLLKRFLSNTNQRSHIWYRWFNEFPVLAFLIISVLVVVKPF